MSWPAVIIFAVIMGIYTALMAMFVPDGNSFHDIAVTVEWWVLPSILVIVNCKKPLEAALKTFVFFLISQPLVYLVQVLAGQADWAIFGYYKYWFMVTLLTFPAAFVAWFVKKDKWYSALVLSGATMLLALTGVGYVFNFLETPPNHLISIIYCFVTAIVFTFAILKKKSTRAICLGITVVVALVYGLIANTSKPYEVYNNSFISENGIELVGEPIISSWSGSGKGSVEIITYDGGYNFKLSGEGDGKNYFTISDGENSYDFEYYFDKDLQTVVVNKK